MTPCDRFPAHADVVGRTKTQPNGALMDEQLDIDLNVLICESEHEYHAKAGEYLTSHLLADFRKCPLLHSKRLEGLVERRDTPAYTLGRAAHCRILEGSEAFQDRYAFGGPINPKTGRPFGAQTKAFAEWAAAQGKPVLTSEQVELVENLATGVARNPQAVDLLLYGQAEGVVRAEYCGTPCQIRIDWLHPHRGIVDFKTCDDLTWFEADAKRYGYVHQMAFYRAVLAQVIGELLAPVHIIAVEKKEPLRCGVWRIDDGALAHAQRENEAAIRRLLLCRQRGDWPTGYEEIRVLDCV